MGTPSGATATATAAAQEKPKPMPMAIMRNAHEVIRGSMRDIQALLDQGDMQGAAALWKKFYRFQEIHKRMEEGCPRDDEKEGYRGMFYMLDTLAGGVVTEAHLEQKHQELHPAEGKLQKVFEDAQDLDEAKNMFANFMVENEEHLVVEEKVMMPSVQKMVKAGVPVKKHLISDVLSCLLKDEGDIEFFLRFANEILQRHDNIPEQPRVRVFNHAFWSVASPEQWNEWNVWIKESLPEEKYAEVLAVI